MITTALLAAAVGLLAHVLCYRLLTARKLFWKESAIDTLRLGLSLAWLLMIGQEAWKQTEMKETILYGLALFALVLVLSELFAKVFNLLSLALDIAMASLMSRVKR